MTTLAASGATFQLGRDLLLGYVVVLAVAVGLAGLVVVVLRRRDLATRCSEQAVRLSEQRLRLAFDEAPIAMVTVGLDGRFQQVNPALCQLLGASREQALELTVEACSYPEDVAHTQQAMERLVAGEVATVQMERRFLAATGETVWGSGSATLVRQEDGTPHYFLVQFQDVTERKQQELALVDQRRRLRQAETVGHIGSWEMDVDTRVVVWSDSLLAIYGLEPDAVTGDYATAVLPRIHADDRDEFDAAVRRCADTGATFQVRHRIRRTDDGRLRWLETSGARDAEGPQPRLTGSVIDVTDQVHAAEEMERARDLALEASRQKSAFLATMSHEIRTPMNAVIGMTGLLLDTSLDAEQREFVETVRTSGDALLSVINDILDFSKIEAGGLQLEQQAFDLVDCVDDSLELVAATSSAKGLELVGHIDDRCPTDVTGDVTRLRQVLVNLLSNAVKFTARGEVVLTVEPHGAPGDAGLRFSVADSGIGIPPDRQARLFESFSQVDTSTTRLYGGTGLGLAISQRLVRAMGGTLAVVSEPDAGSTFSFTIALGRADPVGDASVDRPLTKLRDRSALVVDDNPTNRRILRLQLQNWGIDATEADSGDAAIDLVASGRHFDVALIDMRMPGMSGQELAVRLRSLPAATRLPLLLLSSRTDRPASNPDLELFSAVLTKPVRRSRLQESLRSALSPVGPTVAAGGSGTSARAPLRVLVAEDNAVNQRLGRLMLQKLGHLADVVANGREATEAVHRVPYDVVLMDIEMPEMDGLEATRVIRRELPASRQPSIVAVTASALAEDRTACRDAGMDDYLAKPARLRDLDDALVRTVAARTGPRPAPVTNAPAATGEGAAPGAAVDSRVIDTLVGDLGEGGAADVADLIVAYLRDSDDQLATFYRAATDHDLPLAGSVAHKMKSSTALLGAGTLAGLLGDACVVARRDGVVDGPGLDLLATLIDAEHRRVVSDMVETLHRLGPSAGSSRPQP